MIEDEQTTTHSMEAISSNGDSQSEAPAAPEPTPSSVTPESELDGRMAGLEARIAELEGQVAHEREAATEYMNRWQRAQADFSNFKRRSQQEQEQREALVAGRVVATLLPALDSFERAFASLPPTLRGFSWIDGIALVHLQIHNALAAHGIQPVVAEPGQAFDPMRHESIGEVESADHPEGHIAVVIQRGYEAKGLLLRPTLVQVARAPQLDTASASGADEAGAATAPAADGGEASGV